MTLPAPPDYTLTCNSAVNTSTRTESSFLLAPLAAMSGTTSQLPYPMQQRRREGLVNIIEHAIAIIEQDGTIGADSDK
jgi:hypothetical protein